MPPYVVNPDAPLVNTINRAAGQSYAQGGVYAPAITPQQHQTLQQAQVAPGPDYTKIIADQQAQIDALNRQPVAANVDFAGIHARARQSAEGDINPLYAKMFQDFLTGQQTALQRSQQDATRSNTAIDEALKLQQEQNQLAGERTQQDATTGLSNVANAQDNYQTNEGLSFGDARKALQLGVSQSGLTGSGLGQQAQQQQVTRRNIANDQQQQQFQASRNQIDTLKGRSLADIATSSERAGKTAALSKENTAITLQRFIEDQAVQKQQQAETNRQQQLAAVQGTEGTYAKAYFQDYLKSIQDPGVRQATAVAYGGLV